MPETSLQSASASSYVPLITFAWSSHTEKYCGHEEDLDFGGGDVFSSEPSIEYEFRKAIEGGTDDAPLTIKISHRVSPVDALIEPYKHAKTTVRLEEVDPNDLATRVGVYYGTVSTVKTKKVRGEAVAEITIVGLKSKMSRIVGLQMLTTCPWTFGDGNCQKDLEADKLTGTGLVRLIDSLNIRVSVALTGSPDLDVLLWRKGKLVYDGLAIPIRDVVSPGTNPDPTAVFDLRYVPPPYWANKTVEIYKGCDKQITTCRLHGQESRFGGAGIGTPTYNPVYSRGRNVSTSSSQGGNNARVGFEA